MPKVIEYDKFLVRLDNNVIYFSNATMQSFGNSRCCEGISTLELSWLNKEQLLNVNIVDNLGDKITKIGNISYEMF